MRLILFVASHAGRGRVAILFAGLMTTGACHRRMRVAQWKIRALMIELFGDEFDDIGIAPLMFGVTTLALQRGRIRQVSVESGLLLHIAGNILVTIQTQRGLTDLVGSVVAIGASAFQFGVRIADFAGHQQGFNACRGCGVSE